MFRPRWLPAYVLCRSPRILVAYDTDFLRRLEAFRLALPPAVPFTMLLQTGWSIHDREFERELLDRTAEARRLFPEARFIFLANEEEAVPVLQSAAECLYCHQNAFLDPHRYPMAGPSRLFDAIYVARITPFKRHALAAKVPNLHLVGSRSPSEEEFFQSVMRTVPAAHWDERIPERRIARAIGLARCGLALSAVEGAMFACAEYSLCGIPVVTTANRGGRDALIPGFAAFRAADTPESVAEGVEHWKANPVPAREIRDAFLQLARPHREVLADLLASVAGRRISLPHKLGVRTKLPLLGKLLHGIPRRNGPAGPATQKGTR